MPVAATQVSGGTAGRRPALPTIGRPAGPRQDDGASRQGRRSEDHLLSLLRSPSTCRPLVEPGLCGGLRAWLEDEVFALVADVGAPLVVHRGHLAAVAGGGLAGKAGAVTGHTLESLRHAMARTVFRIAVTAGAPRDPFHDALAALRVDGRGARVIDAMQEMPPDDRATLRRDVDRLASRIAAQWAPPPPAWMPRTAERIVVPLAGGHLQLVTRADLALGAPSRGRSSVCLVDVQAGPPDAVHRADRRFLALCETLRSGAPPFRVATYYPGTGRLDVEEVDDALLSSAVGDAVAAIVHAVDRRASER